MHYRALFVELLAEPSRAGHEQRRPHRAASAPGRPRPPEPTYPGRVRPLVVGFDLDMTLIDTRPGIAAVWDALSAETGVRDRQRGRGQPARAAAGRGARALVPGRAGRRGRRPVPRALPGARRRAGRPAARRARGGRRRYAGTAAAWSSSPASTSRTPGCTSSTSASTSTRWSAGCGARARARRCSSTAPPSTSATTSATSRAPGPRARSASACRPGRSAPTSCGRPAPTSCSTTCTAFPAWLDEHVLDAGWPTCDERLRGSGRCWSPSPAAPTRRSCWRPPCGRSAPTDVVAATAVSASLPAAELDAAARFAADLGVRHLTPATDEMSREGYRANAGDRCYFCKAELLDVLGAARRRARHRRTSPPAPTPTTPRRLPARASGPPPSGPRSPRCSTRG